MKQMADNELMAQILDSQEAESYDGFVALFPVVLGRSTALRSALAQAWDSCISQVHMDLYCGKIDLELGYDMVIEAYLCCSQLCPNDRGYSLQAAGCLVERAWEDARAQALALADLSQAFAILEGLHADPNDQAQVDELFGRGYARLACLSRETECVAAAQMSHAKMQGAFSLQPLERVLAGWWNAIVGWLESTDEPLQTFGRQARMEYDAFAASWTLARPADAALWGEHFTRQAFQGDAATPHADALQRAATIWRAYARHPGLSADALGTIGHSMVRCANALQDRQLFLQALRFHTDGLELDAKNGNGMVSFRVGYVADVCTTLARLPDTDPDSARQWYDHAVQTFRQYPRPVDDFQYGLNYASLLVDRACALHYSPEHPDLEEAVARCAALLDQNGDHYFGPHEMAAAARLHQGKDLEAVQVLAHGLIRLTPFIEIDEVAQRPWFLRLALERRRFLIDGLCTDAVSAERERIAKERGYTQYKSN